MKNIALIGSCGSIGRQVLSVVEKHSDKFHVTAMVTGSNCKLFNEQYAKFAPEYAVVIAPDAPTLEGVKIGEKYALDACALPEVDVVFVACSGFAGLKYSLAALNSGKSLALANKETLVCGGDLVMPLINNGLEIMPVDSEHSAIWQCLNFNRRAPFKNLIITASGGAFRGRKWESLRGVTAKEALAHPTWNMGAKITVDSATLLNKGYEIIEAHHLYDADYSKIKAVIQPTSIVHSMIEFEDGGILAQMGNPTMELPIQLALTYPERLECNVKPMDFTKALNIEFLPLERAEYPLYDLALKCGERGGTAPTLLNAAAEVAVWAFLREKIAFTDIYSVCNEVLQRTQIEAVTSYGALCECDKNARRLAETITEKQ